MLLTAPHEISVQLLPGKLEQPSEAPFVKLLEFLPDDIVFLHCIFICILTFVTTHLSWALAESRLIA